MIARSVKICAIVIAVTPCFFTGGLIAGPAITSISENDPALNIYLADPVAAPEQTGSGFESTDFFESEVFLKTAVGEAQNTHGDIAAAFDALARFYASYELYPEALDAALSIADRERNDAMKLLIAESQFALGRYEKTLLALEDERLASLSAGAALIAMSHARLGAFEKAANAFARSIEPKFLTAAPRRQFPVLTALAAIEAGNDKAAQTLLNGASLENSVPDRHSVSAAERDFLRAILARREGDQRAAGKLFRALSEAGIEPFAARAEIAILARELASKNKPPAEILDAVSNLALNWSGGAFDREILQLIADAAVKSGDLPRAFEARRKLVRRHPHADAAFKAQLQLTEMLTSLFDGNVTLSPAALAQLFYEHIEFAPPGEEGDALIRNVAGQLAALDLHDEAAELLEHQVFQRLRGADRSTIAATLASLYLDSGAPREALRVIRSTRISGLPEDINRARRLLEARALSATARSADALTLLEEGASLDDIRLRADIYWASNDWEEAATAYASVFSAAPAPLNDGARQAALRAAAAYLLAGRDDEFGGFTEDALIRLEGSPERALLETLQKQHRSSASEPDKLDRFMKSYREIFNAGETSI